MISSARGASCLLAPPAAGAPHAYYEGHLHHRAAFRSSSAMPPSPARPSAFCGDRCAGIAAALLVAAAFV
jgi:hypothetical protein